MISLNTWNTLYLGKYGDQELNIVYKDDVFASYLRMRDKSQVIIQVYKVFVAKGDIETFTSTLPYPALFYQKHVDIGEGNNYKYLLLHTDTEYVEQKPLSHHVERKMKELNKRVVSVISVAKSYDIKLTSLKLATENETNYFFSDPTISKTLSNLPLSFDVKGSSPMDKLIIGKKNGVLVTSSLEDLKSVAIYGLSERERLFGAKIICENYLLSSKTVVVFDNTKTFLSLGYPQQDSDILNKFDMKMDPFGFPVRKVDFLKIKVPLAAIPIDAFNNIFKFTGDAAKVISNAYDSRVKDLKDLRKNIEKMDTKEELNDFEKQRIVSKLIILESKYNDFFGETDLSDVFNQRYKHIGSVKIIDVDKTNPFYVYYVSHILEKISMTSKEEMLMVLPESSEILNNAYVGDKVFSIIKDNPTINNLVTSKHETDFKKEEEISNVKIYMVSENDGVVYYPNRDPLRMLFRPTFTSSVVSYKAPKSFD